MNLKQIKDKLKWLDPFTYVDLYVMPKINPEKSELVSGIVYVVFAFVFAFLLYSFLGFVLGTPSPLVIVLSGSMEPVMHRGDIVLIQGTKLEDLSVPEVALDEPFIESKPFSEYADTFCTGRTTGIEEPCSSFGGANPRSFETTSVRFSNGQTVRLSKQGEIIVYNSTRTSEPIIHRAVVKIKSEGKTFALTKGDSLLNPLIDQQAGITNGAIRQGQVQGKAVFQIPFLGYVKLLVFDDIPALIFGCRNPMGCPLP